MGRHNFLSIKDFSPEEIRYLLDLAREIKTHPAAHHGALKAKTLAMIFEKPSLRTRVSFDVGIQQLGGFSLYLSNAEINLGKRESLYDVAKNLERMVQGIMIRTYAHQIVEELAEYASIPIINGLTDYSHPCQAMADYLTMLELKGDLRGLKVAFIGDGNNVCHSLMFAGAPDITDIGALLDVVDGVVLTGARANVHPTRFGTEPDLRHEPYDIHRDELALTLSEVCVARGIPLFGICRGLQEMNVAFGGSLHPEIRDLPGRLNHRMPRLENGEIHPDPNVVFADRHEVSLIPGGAFARILGCETIRVNSLHGQGVLEPGERVIVEGLAEDGTIEAIRIADAPGFALGVQWHAEYDPQRNPINRKLFQAFGEALVERQRTA